MNGYIFLWWVKIFWLDCFFEAEKQSYLVKKSLSFNTTANKFELEHEYRLRHEDITQASN